MQRGRESITARCRFNNQINRVPARGIPLETARCARTVSHENTHGAALFSIIKNLHAVIISRYNEMKNTNNNSTFAHE